MASDKLTNKQLTVYRLIHSTEPPLTHASAAKLLGKDPSSVSKLYKAAVTGLAKMTEDNEMSEQAIESMNPEAAADIVEYASNPLFSTMTEIAAEVGLPYTQVQKFMDRFRGKYVDLNIANEEWQSGQIEKMLNSLIGHIATSVTSADIAGAPLRDKIQGIGTLIHNRQLLRGEPTEILSHGDRTKLEDLMKGMLDEGRRRGMDMTMDADGTYSIIDGAPDTKIAHKRKEERTPLR